ncbi:acyltransferase family protein [Rothia nasimurium]|uniref:acyltransferase family protein n=1 Tax=Rothia nasimurium TaxID=85336 RepID=UPI001F19CB02|nr:acyltransferase family protein [Rothia nasimurium]
MNVRVRRHKPLDSFIEQPKFRPEVQGLRSLAVLLVVTYHVWFGKVSGGVDVFLFISAFLLSLSSLRKIQAGKPLKILSYWLHVFQRLLPAAATVIVGTLIASYFIIAPSRWASLLADAKAALFYFLNWRLALNSVDYYAQDATTKTPFQHFWSLSMQGQIFILWPLLFALVAFLVGYLRFKVIPTALLIFGSAFVASLTFSILETSTNQSFAYFDTRTRLWEFAAGTLLAMLVLTWRVPQVLKVPLGWLGVIGLVSCGWLLPVEQAFPGYLALWPLLSGAFVIAAGQTGSRFGVDRILSATPLQKMGAISYCLYLVHWPLLILYTTYQGEPQAGWLDGTLIILVSIGLAWLLHNSVEKPLRAWGNKPAKKFLNKAVPQAPWAKPHKQSIGKPIRAITTVAVSLSLVGGLISYAQDWAAQQEIVASELTSAAGSDDFPGGRALEQEFSRYQYPPIPVMGPGGQFELGYYFCEGVFSTVNPELMKNCTYEQYGDENAPLTIIVGASHAGQAVAMWREVAIETQTNFKDMHLGSCRFPDQPSPDEECFYVNSNIVQEIIDVAPDNVLLMVTVTDPESNKEILMPGVEEAIKDITDAGINVIALRDNPRFNYNIYECAQIRRNNTSSCGAPVEEKISSQNPAESLISSNSRVYGVDMTEYYCPSGYCEAVIGNIYVYMDDNHISRSYGKTLGPYLLKELQHQGWEAGRDSRSSGQELDTLAEEESLES